MIRVSTSQAKLLFGTKPHTTRPPRPQKRTEDLPENIVERQCLDLLRSRRWSVERQQVGTFVSYFEFKNTDRSKHPRVVKIGTKGQCDWLAQRSIPPIRGGAGMPFIESFEIELKAPGKSPSPHQLEYMRKRNAVGFTAVWFDSFDALLAWYRERWPTEFS